MSGTWQPAASSRSRIAATAAAAAAVSTVMRTSSDPASASAFTCVHRRRDIGGVGVGHRLDDDRRAAADHRRRRRRRAASNAARWCWPPRSFEYEARHVPPRIRSEVEALALPRQRDIGGIADHDIERRSAADRLRRSAAVHPLQQDATVPVLHFSPGEIAESEHERRFANRRHVRRLGRARVSDRFRSSFRCIDCRNGTGDRRRLGGRRRSARRLGGRDRIGQRRADDLGCAGLAAFDRRRRILLCDSCEARPGAATPTLPSPR